MARKGNEIGCGPKSRGEEEEALMNRHFDS